VHAGADEITVEVPDYGSTGTVLSSLTTRKADYQRVSATHENPRASECLSEIEPDGGDDRSSDDGDTSGDATFTIGPLETNTPIDSGESLEVSVTVENTGGAAGTQELELLVGTSAELVERRSVSLDAGERTVLSTGYEKRPSLRTITSSLFGSNPTTIRPSGPFSSTGGGVTGRRREETPSDCDAFACSTHRQKLLG